ncbi:hypothetical protein [Hathewaya massiliensis]|uniref:hypothetical protein n=1 Tax=Hathewaya massiliensis TaxID=1964382 RepID=UPI00163C9CCA|nr:hypothetical protein [Hathewaya massiliensis]
MVKSLEILIESINSQLAILNANNFKIHDEDNTEFYIKEVYYSKEDDKLYFRCCEEEK